MVDGLRAPAIALDPTLEKPWTKTRETLLGALDAFAAKVEAAAARRGGVAQQRFDQLRQATRPNGGLQERVLSTAWFAGRYGADFGAALLDQLGARSPQPHGRGSDRRQPPPRRVAGRAKIADQPMSQQGFNAIALSIPIFFLLIGVELWIERASAPDPAGRSTA